MNIFGALIGAAISIPVVYVWGRAGSSPAYMVLGRRASAFFAWYYARRIRIQPVKVPIRRIASEAGSLIKLGVVFLASGLMTSGSSLPSGI